MPKENGYNREGTGRFKPGNPGRPKGITDKITREIITVKTLAAQLLLDKTYMHNLAIRLRTGEAPHMEKFFAEHLWGKPKEHLSISLTEVHLLAVRTMSDLELSAFLAALDQQKPEEALKLLPGGKVA